MTNHENYLSSDPMAERAQASLDVPQALSARIACPSCDLVFDVTNLQHGETARCSRCGAFLTTYRRDGIERIAAYSTAALVLLVMSCAFPFLAFSRSGLENTMTLPQTVADLWSNGMPELALLVAGFILGIPAVVLTLLLLLAIGMLRGQPAPWLRPIGSLIFHLYNWSMVEVFFVGVLVSLVKITKLASISLGISFWAYAGFSVLFILAISNLDRYQCWQRIEALSQ
jgi:paraquat-inducible protein A